MGECEFVLEKGKEVLIAIFDKTCTMKFTRACKAVKVMGK